MTDSISENFLFDSHHIEIMGSQLHYFDEGKGNPIVFLHSIPLSNYSWRNIIPYLTSLGRCIAPDFIGMGKSDKPDLEYSVSDHIEYLEKFIEKLGLKNITFVMHGIGSVIGLDYAMRHEKNCKGLVFYEAFLRPMSGDALSLPYQEQIANLEEQNNNLSQIVDRKNFIDSMISQYTLSELSEQQIEDYKKPFLQKGTEKPLMQYLQELPRGDGKSKIDQVILRYSKKLTQSYLPKLLLYSIPGFITTIATVMWAKENLRNLEIAEVGEDLHLAQENNPNLMGETISIWFQGIE